MIQSGDLKYALLLFLGALSSPPPTRQFINTTDRHRMLNNLRSWCSWHSVMKNEQTSLWNKYYDSK